MEKPEINLESVHRLIDSLQSQAKDGNVQDMLSATQRLLAELQQIHLNNGHAAPRHASVSVVMPFAGKPVERHVALAAPTAPLSAPLAEGDALLQPPTILTEAVPAAATDSHSFGKVEPIASSIPVPPRDITIEAAKQAPVTQNTPEPASTTHTEPIQKELFTLQPENEDLSFTPLQAAEYPTSVPEDSPQIQQAIQQEQQDHGEPTVKQASVEAAQANAANVQPPLTQAPDFTANGQSENPDEQESPVPAASNNTQENITAAEPDPENSADEVQADKRRHLAFIHENFSTWADYGMPGGVEAPTLVQNQPLTKEIDNSYNSSYQQQHYQELNEQLSQPEEEWAHKMQSTPIENLASAIGINDRYLFISELFRGDESMYERSIITLNKFNSFPEAHAWSERELRLKLGWDTQNPITKQFEQLIERRFMSRS
jgi:hypothetical protein